MTLPPPGQPRRWPMHRERYSPQDTARHVTERLAKALANERLERTWPTFGASGAGRTAWRIGHHAGRLFALRERSREEYERTHWLMHRWDGAMRALAKGGER